MRKRAGKRAQLVSSISFLNNPDTAQLRDVFFVYGFSVLISISIALVAVFLTIRIDGLNPSLILLIPVILSAWYGGFNAGMLSILLTSVFYFGYIYFFLLVNLDTLFNMILLTPIGILLSFIIDRSKKSDELKRYKKESMRYAQKLFREEKANIQAQEEIRARDELLSIASHELKTPLTLVLLQIQSALHNIKNVSLANFSVGKLLELLESVEQQTQRLSRMISDMLNVSIITTGKLNLEIEETDLVQIVKDVSKRLPQTMSRKNYPITINIKDSVIGFWDKIRIEQAVVNLISNAIKYGNNKPVEITLRKSDQVAELIIKDHGIGIPKESRKKIFERFERGARNKDYQGLGVGLYITGQIIKSHGGTIAVDSRENKGSTFTVELPIKRG